MRQRAGQLGFTLVELLVASVIMVTILGALGSLFVSTSKAYRANDEASALQQSADAAGELLSYEVGLAGYRGSTDAVGSRTFAIPTLEIETTPSTTPDQVTVSYYEDRFQDAATPPEIAAQFSVDTNNHTLYRHKSGDRSKQPAVEDVYNFKVLRYIRKDGRECNTVIPDELATLGDPGTLMMPGNLAGLRLELTFTGELRKQVIIPLPNTQTSSSTDLPTLTALPNPAGC